MNRFISIALGTALALYGCAGAHTRGIGTSTLSTENEEKLGAEMSKMVTEEMGLVDDAVLLKYVQSVGARVAKESPRQDVVYSFQIVNSSAPNAFALPGGYLYVSRGILALCNSEDELAGVLGHEIGHVAAHHASQSLTRAVVMSPVTIATNLGGSLAGIVAPRVGGLIKGVGETTTGLVLSPHSRTQEHEADRLGQEMTAKAGYDPAALTRALNSLLREEALESNPESRPNSFLATHPATSERVQQTGERAKTMAFTPRPGIARDRSAFLKVLDGLLVGEDARKGVFIATTFIHPAQGFTLHFPDGWKTTRSKDTVLASSAKEDAVILTRVLGGADERDRIIQERLRVIRGKAPVVRRTAQGLNVSETQGTLGGRAKVHAAWIEHNKKIYEIVGAAEPKVFDAYENDFSAVINSFRPVEAADLAGIKEPRLVISQVRQKSDLSQWLKQFSDTAWSLDKTAVYNGLSTNASLDSGHTLKIAVQRPLQETLKR